MLCALALPFGSSPRPREALREEYLLEMLREEGNTAPIAPPVGSRRAKLPAIPHAVNLLSAKQPPTTVGADSIDITCHSIAEAGQGIDDQWCIDNCSPYRCPLSVCSHGCQDRSGGKTRAEVAAEADDGTLPQEIAATMPNLLSQPGSRMTIHDAAGWR